MSLSEARASARARNGGSPRRVLRCTVPNAGCGAYHLISTLLQRGEKLTRRVLLEPF
jgi:DNA-binding transcriptional LysR family regulator